MAFAMNFDYRNGSIHWMDTPGKRIRALRQSKGLSQVTVAGLAGMDQSTLSDIENDKGFSAENLMRLCEVLTSDARYIMRGTSGADDVLQRVKVLIDQAQNEKTSLTDVSATEKPPIAHTPKARTLKSVSTGKKPQLNPEVRRKLVSKKGSKNERRSSKAKKKSGDGETS